MLLVHAERTPGPGDIRRTEPGSVLIADQWVTVHVQVSLSQPAAAFLQQTEQNDGVSAPVCHVTVRSPLSPPLSPLWLYALTELAFTVQDLEELHQPLSSNLSSNIGLDLSRAAGKPRAQLRMSSLLIHSSFFFVCVCKNKWHACHPSPVCWELYLTVDTCLEWTALNASRCTLQYAVQRSDGGAREPYSTFHLRNGKPETFLPPHVCCCSQKLPLSLAGWGVVLSASCFSWSRL